MPKTSTSNTTTDEEGEIEEIEQDSVSVTFGDFPINNWKEWDKDCKEKFGDCRWMKAWNDHRAAQQLQVLQDSILPQIEELKTEIANLKSELQEKKQETEKEPEEPMTLGEEN